MWKVKNAFIEYASYLACKYLAEIRDLIDYFYAYSLPSLPAGRKAKVSVKAQNM